VNRFTLAAKALFARVTPLEQDTKRSPPKDDVASLEKAVRTLGPRYNPDQLVGRQGLAIYDKMRLDEQVKAVMNFKRDAITARGWTFKYEEYSSLSETERGKRIRVFTEIMAKMHGSFLDALNLVATGRDYGFSMTEKVYTDVTIDGSTYVGLNLLLARAPDTFEFYVDDYGILQRVEQVVPGRRKPIDMSRMIHYVHSPEFDRFYGRSDLREAYRAWFIKQRIQEFWVEYLERMAGGLVALTPKDESNPAPEGSAVDLSIKEVLKNLHSSAGIKVPAGYELEVHFPATTDAFEKAVIHHDLAIAKALLVPNLLGISHAGQTGAFAQSQTQLEAFFWTLNADSARLEACINEQLVKDLGDQNFGDGEYPYFCFKPASREHVKQVIADWKVLVDAGAVVATEEDEEHFRKLLDMPKPGGNPLMDPMEDRKQTLTEDGQEFDQGLRKKQDDRAERQQRMDEKAANEERYAAIRGELTELKTLISGPRPAGDAHNTAKANGADTSTRPQADSLKLQRTMAMSRVAFAVIDSRQNRMAADLVSQVAAHTAKVTKRLLGTDEQLVQLIDNDPSDVAGVEFSGSDKSKLKEMFRRNLSSAWTLGGSMARNELERARGQRFVQMRDLRDTAAEYFEVNGFRMAGNVSDGVRALIQQELQNSIKFGRTAKVTREVIWDRLVQRGFTSREQVREYETDADVIRALNDLWGVSEPQAAAYLDTLARTNLFEAMNEARYAEFTDPALGDFVVAMEYSAILDDRTTEICEHLNGKQWPADSEVWDQYRPPNHFNCRSVLIPITAIDGWDGQESSLPSVQPQAGFGGTLQ
jgi:SPP1 gp7 family putative phage head morphogenesis protein